MLAEVSFPKNYTGELLPQLVIEQMLENENWAPNHKQTEPWRFAVFKGSGLTTLADFQSECYKQVTKADNTFREDKSCH